MSNERPAHLFVVIAPSGAGKTTLCRRVLARLSPTIRFSVSHTTRPPRGGERHGVEYYFVSDAEFQAMVDRGALAEWAQVHAHRYGTSHAEIERAGRDGVDLLLDIDGQGAEQILRQYPAAVRIFILPPSLADLQLRLQGRGTDSAEQIALRLANARAEIRYAERCEYVMVNADLAEAARELEAVIIAQRCRRENRRDAIRRLDTA
jgi:guanylate kinase